MNDVALGRRVRTVRIRMALRQSDVAARAGVSQDTVSRIERGRLGRLRLATVRAVLEALEIELRLNPVWRGGELDRLVDEDHAAGVGATADLLETLRWATNAEVSFAVYGERGSIDLVAWHEPTRTLLIIEVKTRLYAIEETLRVHDTKVRLAATVVQERFGWQPLAVARLLVLPDESTPRRQVVRHAAVLNRVYPVRGAAARAWLANPSGRAGLLMFLSRTPRQRGRRGSVKPQRVRRVENAQSRPRAAPRA
jgi:transcriptional regulator with XRE-family HTH domain